MRRGHGAMELGMEAEKTTGPPDAGDPGAPLAGESPGAGPAGPGAGDGPVAVRATGRERWLVAVLAAAVGCTFLFGALDRLFLCDDAFISFRYARHLAEGEGLVWNPGERVEGYTNFLWVLAMAAGIALGARPELLAPALGILCGAAVVALVARLGARDHGWRDPLIWLAPAALALHHSFLAWSTGGLETQFFSLLVLAGFSACLDERRRREARPWLAPGSFALATLTRPDGLLFAAVAGSAWLVDCLRRRRGLRPAVAWATVFASPVLAHVLWRRGYYGEWLPNTFYAKVTGFQWEEGFRYLSMFGTVYQLHFLLVLAVLAVAVRRGFREAMFCAVIVVDLLYLCALGGDFLEFRFLVPILPYLYWLMADGVRVIQEWAMRSRRRWAVVAAPVAAVALLVATAVSPVATAVSRSIEPPSYIESVNDARKYAVLRSGQGRYLAGLVDRGLLPADLRIATGGIGVLSYYTDWYVIDHHGLTDRWVARAPVTTSRIGHQRRVTVAYIKQRRVDAVELSKVMAVPGSASLPTVLEVARRWLESYNRGFEDPDLLLRLRCVEVEPETFLVFGTNLDPEEERRLFGRFPSCPLTAPPPPGPSPPAAGGTPDPRTAPDGTPPPSAAAPRR